MMRKFLISINGKSYEVEVEEVTTPANPIVPDPIKIVSPVVEKKEELKSSIKEIPTGTTLIKAPMPGTILDVNVSVGEAVSKGQILLILEAMKMENELLAPREGKIISIQIQKGSSVNPGDVLVTIE